MDISFAAHRAMPTPSQNNIVVVPVFSHGTAGVNFGDDQKGMGKSGLDLIRSLRQKAGFQGHRGDIITVPEYGDEKIMFVGMGDAKTLDSGALQSISRRLYDALKDKDASEVHIFADRTPDAMLGEADIAAQLADGLLRRTYRFDKYKTMGADYVLESATILTSDPAKAEAAFAPLRAVTQASFWAADLANEPPNMLYPKTYAEEIERTLKPLGVKIRTLEPWEIQALGMNGVWNVGKGSDPERHPRVVIMEYNGRQDTKNSPVFLVGKGVTFDTGGISIKPGAGMDDMKYDMGGSAAVVGAIRAAAERGARRHIVGLVGLAENTPSHTAFRPGDIIKTMAGLTVHVGNTDAEGRLVLCDLLHLAQNMDKLRRFPREEKQPEFTIAKPAAIIDAATLTGAQLVATGEERAAIFAEDESLTAKFKKAGDAVGEKCWPLPTGAEYENAMRHRGAADLNNMAAGNRAGTCTARAFLRFFVERNADGSDKYPWVHIDMAGPGMKYPGWGVRLLDRVMDDMDEKPSAKPAPAQKAPRGPAPKP